MDKDADVAGTIAAFTRRWGSLASAVAGMLWLLVWLHQRQAHGTTSVNEKRIVLGLTWMDSAKFLVVPLCLVALGLMDLYIRRGRTDMLTRAALPVAMAGLAGMLLGTAAQFWPIPWGSYARGFDEPLLMAGGIVQGLGSLVFTFGLAGFMIGLARAKLMPIWAALVMVAGALTTFYLTPVSWVPAVAWLLLAWVLASGRGQTR